MRDALVRIGGLEQPLLRPIVGADSPERYRNKAQIPVGAGKNGELLLGYYAPRSHRIVDCSDCLLQPEVFGKAVDLFRAWAALYRPEPYDEATHKGKLRHLYLRLAEKTGELMFCLVVNGNGLRGEEELARLLRAQLPALKSVIVNSNRERTNVILGPKCRTVWGNDFITDELCGLRFRISPLSFYQVNRAQAERLYGIARRYAALESGIRCSIFTAERAPSAFPWRPGRRGSSAWRSSPRRWRMQRRTRPSTALKTPSFSAETRQRPPSGCARREFPPGWSFSIRRARALPPSWSARCVKSAPSGWSTSPATRAPSRGTSSFFPGVGYEALEATPVDMFPRTAHVETVCLLTRRN